MTESRAPPVACLPALSLQGLAQILAVRLGPFRRGSAAPEMRWPSKLPAHAHPSLLIPTGPGSTKRCPSLQTENSAVCSPLYHLFHHLLLPMSQFQKVAVPLDAAARRAAALLCLICCVSPPSLAGLHTDYVRYGGIKRVSVGMDIRPHNTYTCTYTYICWDGIPAILMAWVLLQLTSHSHGERCASRPLVSSPGLYLYLD